jgi:hypothetical protein
MKICERIFHTGAKLYEPHQLRKKIEDHGLEVLSVKSTSLGYFLTAVKRNKNKGSTRQLMTIRMKK